MKKLLYLTLLASLFSCDIMKKSQKSKEDLDFKEYTETKSYRPSDSVSFRPPVLNPKFKDTTIYRVTKNNTRLETVYDSSGNIRDINCYTDKIEELTRKTLELEYQNKLKDKEKTEEFDGSFILYLVIGAVVIILLFMFLMYRATIQNGAAIIKLLEIR